MTIVGSQILSLGRNNIKAFAGLEAVGDTLEELWISNNMIEKTKGIGSLKKLRVCIYTHTHSSNPSLTPMRNKGVKEQNKFDMKLFRPAYHVVDK